MQTNKARALPLVASPDLCNVPCFKGDLVRQLRSRMPSEGTLRRTLTVFGVLGERQRLKILHALKDGEELCVCDVAHVLGVSVSVASHHLRKMRDLGILRDRNDGKMKYYSLGRSAVSQLVSRALAQAR